MIIEGELTPAQRRRVERMINDEHGILREVVCRFWAPDVWPAKWESWLAWWEINRNGWLGPRRAFGVWLRLEVDEDAAHARVGGGA